VLQYHIIITTLLCDKLFVELSCELNISLIDFSLIGDRAIGLFVLDGSVGVGLCEGRLVPVLQKGKLHVGLTGDDGAVAVYMFMAVCS